MSKEDDDKASLKMWAEEQRKFLRIWSENDRIAARMTPVLQKILRRPLPAWTGERRSKYRSRWPKWPA